MRLPVCCVSMAICLTYLNISTSYPIADGGDKRWNSSNLEMILKRGYIRATGGHVTLKLCKDCEGMTTPCHHRICISVNGCNTRAPNKWNFSTERSRLQQNILVNDTLLIGCDVIGKYVIISPTCHHSKLNSNANDSYVTLMSINRTLDEAGLIAFMINSTNMSCIPSYRENSLDCSLDVRCKLVTDEKTSKRIFSLRESCDQVNICVYMKTLSNSNDPHHRQSLYPKGRRKKRGIEEDPKVDVHQLEDHVTADSNVIEEPRVASRTKHADQNNISRQNPETSRTAMTASLALLGVALVMITVALSIIFKSEEEAEQPERKDEATEKLLIEGGE